MNDQKTVSEHYLKVYGEEPDVIVRSCGRVNIIGGHTDYNDGLVLPGAIDKYLYFAVGRNPSGNIRFEALDIGKSYETEGLAIVPSDQLWANYLLGIINQFQKRGVDFGGISCTFGGNLPIGAGVSSSAALEGGFAVAINRLLGCDLDKIELAKLAQRSSHEFVGIPCGIMDQFASLMGQERKVLQLDCQTLEYSYHPFDSDAYVLLLLNSNVSHSLAESAYAERVEECQKGLEIISQYYPEVRSFRDVDTTMVSSCKIVLGDVLFRRCDYVVKEIGRVKEACERLDKGDFQGLGELMFETHQGLRNDYEVSCAEIDFLVGFAAKQKEVLGARIMGGGFGGCTINLVEKRFVELFKSKARMAYKNNFGHELDTMEVNIVEGTKLMT